MGRAEPGMEGGGAGSHEKAKGGFTHREIEEVWAAGWKLSLAAVIRLKVRYFTDGVVLGSQAFVDEFFARQREFFWSAEEERREKDEGRGLDWGGGGTVGAARSESKRGDAARVARNSS